MLGYVVRFLLNAVGLGFVEMVWIIRSGYGFFKRVFSLYIFGLLFD